MCQRSCVHASHPYQTLWTGLKEALTVRLFETDPESEQAELLQVVLFEMEDSENKIVQAGA
ncbi:hypothetical protein P8918_13810 [Bacillus spizizenii]|nr:hypothetical protein [Bacillus spizizenii]MCY8890379.1 hypothetical protein [Bacillus spizizenii]MEC0842105.1 hypothetical protein [Bacillus spizizenii]